MNKTELVGCCDHFVILVLMVVAIIALIFDRVDIGIFVLLMALLIKGDSL